MLKNYILIFSVLFSFSAFSQEICDNGIDDDANGLVDLNDPECHCGAGLNAQFNNAIPNAGFDGSSCCPTNWYGNLNCLNSWSTNTTTTNYSWGVHYANACSGCNYFNNTNYIAPPECSIPGNGFLGMAFWNNNNNNLNFNNHANACLNNPLYPGSTYVLEFDAFNTYNYNWQFTDDTIHMSLLGSTSCANIPVNTQTNCIDPDWPPLDSIEFVVAVDTNWHTFSFTFSPTDTIYAIALGQTCHSNLNNQTYTGWQRLYLDNLILYDSKTYNLQIAESGSVCNLPYILTSSIDTTGGTWQWYKDSVALVGETNTTLDISAMGIGNYTVLYKMNGTCQGLNLEVPLPIYPLAFMTPDNTTTCVGDSIQFDGFSYISDGTIDQYYYDFGNGDSAFIEDPIYAFDSAGVYTVTITAESNLGCQGGQTQNITIHAKPVVDFLTNNVCLYDVADFVSMTTLSVGLIDSLAWEFGDNAIADDSLESHSYAAAGDYNVQLYARSDEGCVDSINKTISIHSVPEANYTANNACENTNIAFLNNSSLSTGNIISYLWNFGNNNTAVTLNTNHIYTVEGNYPTSLIATSDSGCVDTSNLVLVVHPEPLASFSSFSSCFLATFENNSTIPSGVITTNNWDFGNSNTSTEESTTHYYSANANYNVTLETISDFGCVDDTVVSIAIYSNFFAELSPKTNNICVGECIKLFNNSTPTPNQVMKYFWRTSDGQTSTERNPTFCFSDPVNEPTNYDVFFKISTSSGCLDSILVEDAITVIPIPVADFTFSPEKPVLENPEVTFKNLSTLSQSYEWNFGDNNYSNEINPMYTYPNIGKQYTVRLTASDANNTCHDEHSELLVVQDEILFFIPNSFTPDGSGKNDRFRPQFISGIDIYQFRLQIFDRWGALIFESNDPLGSWDGFYGGAVVTEGTYVWKLDFIETMVDKTHTHTGTVNVLR